MRVLEDNPWQVERRCTGEGNGGGGCNALLLVEREDLFDANCDAFTRPFMAFACPRCGTFTDLPRPLWPPDWERTRGLPGPGVITSVEKVEAILSRWHHSS